MKEIQGKTTLVLVSEGSSYWELTVFVSRMYLDLANFLNSFVQRRFIYSSMLMVILMFLDRCEIHYQFKVREFAFFS